ncbi:hypothetical protein LSH36_857g00105 [Paralvinella palmiformis]|uniref:NEDD8-activating enzyme E1 regulatory subunit n=1 Tax=Paralvinella palmiformis TaxID=53620 RepID=A0AAD9IZ84_9ANNE|nr:hypothetical protein LSH36_857g00105 [Paralvinella palmiformis]
MITAKTLSKAKRLWGDHGQSALEGAKVCLINATATGTEILKNLILPGVGSFTIIDGKRVSGEDVGNNFFLDQTSIGKSRAQVATELMQELNADVSGDFVDETADNLLDNSPEFFNKFTIVVATSLSEKILLRLASHLWDNEIPLIICRSYGFIGYVRLVVREHTVIESHPDNVHEDLRLDRPFPALVEFCDSFNLDTMNKKEHSHTPWLVIIYKYLEKWKQQHNGESPKNYKEKNQLKETIREGFRKNEDGVPEDEENFDEAIKNVNTALLATKVPTVVEAIFSDSSTNKLHFESKPFWILAQAVKEFVHNEGKGALPLRGSIPDMTADSERYIQLQNVYRQQAKLDVDAVSNYVQNLLESIGRPQDNITEKDIRAFCKNASFLCLLRSRSLEQEYDVSSAKIADIAMHLEDTDDDDLVFYVMLRAVDRFFTEYNRYPGYDMDTVESDIPKLKTCLSKWLQEYGINQNIKDEYVHELCRYGACELHSVAAYIGGAAAQEVIKVITSQFVPINNTYIYNGMKQTSLTVEL